MNFDKIFKELNKRGITYLLAGGIAVNLYGYIRATADMDIMIVLDKSNIEKYIAMIKELGYKPRVPVDLNDFADEKKRKLWITEKNMKAFSVFNPKHELGEIDVILESPIPFDEAYQRRVVMKINGKDVFVVSIADLIKLKEAAGRGRDKIDIEALKKIQGLKRDE